MSKSVQLITTAYFPSWLKNDDPILFLGKWCKPITTESQWQGLDYSVQPYHGADNESVEKDSDKIFNFYVSAFRKKKNTLFVEYSEKYVD